VHVGNRSDGEEPVTRQKFSPGQKLTYVVLVSIVLDLTAGWGLMLGLGNLGINIGYGDGVWTAMTLGMAIGASTALGRTIKLEDL
jgi:hypothetical protein